MRFVGRASVASRISQLLALTVLLIASAGDAYAEESSMEGAQEFSLKEALDDAYWKAALEIAVSLYDQHRNDYVRRG